MEDGQKLSELLVLALEEKQHRSTQRLYFEAGRFGAMTRLLEHFGSLEAVEQAGLQKQLEFLLDDPQVNSLKIREKLAMYWLHHKRSPTAPDLLLGIEGETRSRIAEIESRYLLAEIDSQTHMLDRLYSLK